MEGQLADFIDTFSKWRPQDFVERNVIGLNWYHAGSLDQNGEGSMSDAMIATIAAGRLDKLPYVKTVAAAAVA